MVIGRSADVEIALDDPEASRRHAEIRTTPAGCVVVDLQSRNGTLVNGERITEHTLRDGDVIQIGRSSLTFLAPVAAAPPEPPAPDPTATVVMAQTMRMPAAPSQPPAAAQPVAVGAGTPLQVLGRISRLIAGVSDAKALGETVTRAIRDQFNVEGAVMLLKDRESGALYYAAVSDPVLDLVKLMADAAAQSLGAEAVAAREPIVASAAERSDYAARMEQATGVTPRSFAAAPILGMDGNISGALEMFNPRAKAAFVGDDGEFLALVGQQLAIALGNVTSWEALDQERQAASRVDRIRDGMVATTPGSVKLIMEVAALYAAGTPVYLAGEPGTGKQLLARLTHDAFETAGAFIGLDASAAGQIALKDGTAFVKDISSLPADAQDRLAAVIGSTPGARFVAVGPAPLLTCLSEGWLTPALHAALERGEVLVPPLRARTEELGSFIAHFTERDGQLLECEPVTFTDDALAILRAYSWPENVAAFERLCKRVAVLAAGPVIDGDALIRLAPELAPPGTPQRPGRALSAIERARQEREAQAIADLSGDDPGQRHEAVARLSAFTGQGATDGLRGALDDPVPSVRLRAAEALHSRPGAGAAVAARLERESEPAVAVALLGVIGAEKSASSFNVVRRGLKSPDPTVRAAAMRALRLSDPGPERAEAEAAATDPAPPVRAEGLAALFQLGDVAAGEPLIDLASTGAPEDRGLACALLAELHIGTDRLVSLLAEDDRAVRTAVVRSLSATGVPDVPVPSPEPQDGAEVRTQAIRAIGMLRAADALPMVGAVAADESAPPMVRREALGALARIGDPRAVPMLAASLSDPATAAAAIAGLALLAGSAAEAPILAALPALAPEALVAAVEALGKVGTRDSIPALFDTAAGHPDLTEPAFDALLEIGRRMRPDGDAFDDLAAAVATASSRDLALMLLGDLGDSRAIPYLLRYLDSSPEARVSLLKLQELSVDALVDALREHPELEDGIAQLLLESGQVPVNGLLRLTLDPDIGQAASRIIEHVGVRAAPAVVDALEAGGVAADAPRLLQLLGRLRGGRVEAYVASFLTNADVRTRYAALVALGDLPGARSERELLALLDAADPPTRALATLSLGRIQSADGFEQLMTQAQSAPERLSQYALAGAVGNYNLRQAPVMALVREMALSGRPVSAAALQEALLSGAVSTDDLHRTLADEAVPSSQKLRLISILGHLPPQAALDTLLTLLRGGLDAALRPALIVNFVRYEGRATAEIASLLTNPTTRALGIEVLSALHEPESLMTVLRAIAPLLDTDEALRATLHEMGDLALGPLLDRVYEDWDLDTLELLWRLGETAVGPAAGTGG
jgi:transcriptional regulator with GAF, ATPase, and Fis domain